MKKDRNIEDNDLKQVEVRESTKKKDTNLQSNSTLYFQIGLILCLLATYGLFEMNFKTSLSQFATTTPLDEHTDFYLPDILIVPNEEPKEQPKEKIVKQVINKDFVIKKNDYVIKNPVELVTPESLPPVIVDKPTKTVIVPVTTPIVYNKIFDIDKVERVPVFPGCESASNNAERMACMSEKLTKLIQKKFNTSLAAELGLSGVQKIQVQFRIDDTGHVTDVKTRSAYSQLEKEAERVVNKIPVMTPGMQQNSPVSVVYNLPISFQVQ